MKTLKYFLLAFFLFSFSNARAYEIVFATGFEVGGGTMALGAFDQTQ